MSALSTALASALLPRDVDSLETFEPALAQAIAPRVRAALGAYFRARVRGLENVPTQGPALIVGNHNGGLTFLEPFVFAAEYYAQRGFERPLRFLGHDAMVRMPGLGHLLTRMGVVRASPANGRAALGAGELLVVFPGGNREAFRPWRERHRIDFGGHKGFAALALEQDVPIIPMLNLGGHNTFVVLSRGERLARALRADRLVRSPAFPISLALPWGIGIGPVFHLPLPARFTIELGPAIRPTQAVGALAPAQRVEALYALVVKTLQEMMDRVAGKALQ